VHALREAGSIALSDAEVGPCQLDEACAPHIAAALQGRSIDRVALHRAALALGRRADRVVVEGVGGFCVPLGPDWDSADLAADLGLPVLMVVGLRLGCINHALLTAEAVRARGLTLAGWVGNTVDPAMARLGDNIDALRHELGRRHAAPCFGIVPRLPVADPAAVAAFFDAALLRSLFDHPSQALSPTERCT
jgi:dethiobiotin synthetase